MRGVALTLRIVLLLALSLPFAAGCASTRSGGSEAVPSDPKILCDELREIRSDIGNVEEMIKGTKAELNMMESPDLRTELRELEMELYHLRSRERALIERSTELGVDCGI